MGAVASYEKRILQDAAAALKANQSVITEGFALELNKAIAEDDSASNAKKTESAPLTFSSLRFDQLELMGDDQVQETLDGARLQQFLLLAADMGSSEFSARLSTAQGFKMVQPDKNPLRPEVFSQALLKLIRRLPVDNDARSRWLTHGAQLLGKELQTLYVMLDELLEEQGVALAPYGVVATADDKPRHANRVDMSHGASAPAGYPNPGGTGHHPMYGGYGSRREDAGSGYSVQGFYDPPLHQSSYVLPSGQSWPSQFTYSGQLSHPEPGRHSVHAVPSVAQFQAYGSFAPNGSFGPNGSVGISREQLLTLDHLHRLMVGDYDESIHGSPAPADFNEAHAGPNDFSQTLPAALDALAELEEQGLMGFNGNKVRAAPALSIALLREQLKAEAKTMGQALGIEVVGLMIEQLANDERLLPPVRQLIAEAEPAFLRLGLTDPRFFSDKKHPARLLLEAITAKSLAFSSENAPGFDQFMQDVREVSNVLKEGYLTDAQDFSALLADFEEKQSHQTPEASVAHSVAVQALLRVEQRNMLAEKIAQEIRERPDFISGNRAIASFLTGPWAHVMAHERLLGEHAGMGSSKAVYSLTLGDLLWSLNVVQASRHRKRLVEIIPGMLNAVREGLLSISYPLDQSKAFYEALMSCHEAAIKPVVDHLGAGFSSYEAAEKAVVKVSETGRQEGHAHDEVAGEPWLAPSEAQQSGFMDDFEANNPSFAATAPLTQAQLLNEPVNQAPVVSDKPAEASSRSSLKLLLGAWLELLSESRWVRAQLTWISPHNTLFMFTSDGGRSHSMTSRMLQQLITTGRIRIISEQGLLEGALDSVARTAMRNSMERSADS